MSNHIPTIPGSWNLQSVLYKISTTYLSNFAPASGSTLDWSPAVNSTIPSVASNEVIEFMFNFITPGTLGSFDQDTAETQIKAFATDYCTALNDFFGDSLSNVKASVTITREWTWVDASTGNYTTTLTDTLTYP
jgi:hypothetical protein